MRLAAQLIVVALALAVAVVAVVAFVPPRPPPPARIEWAEHAEGPAASLAVGWVGHGALGARDPHAPRPQSVPERVGWFAQVYGLPYEGVELIREGAILSSLWHGEVDGSVRPVAVASVTELLARRLDALVVTEAVPVGRAMEREHSSFYLQRFYCAFLERNPAGRVYLYESWPHLQASDRDAGYPPPHRWDWPAQVRAERARWQRLADEAMTGQLAGPTARHRLARWFGAGGQCDTDAPIFRIPVATVFEALANRLRKPHGWTYRGRPMDAASLVVNPYASWPAGWPTGDELPRAEVRRALGELLLVHPGEARDDLRPSDLGVYVAALTSFAVLYRRSPVGLPTVGGVPPDAAHAIQELIWGIVREDPRAGVAPR